MTDTTENDKKRCNGCGNAARRDRLLLLYDKRRRTVPNVVRKGYCVACPFDYGKPEIEMAFNMGCLPGIGEVDILCGENGTAWACHSEPNKVCCGHAARRDLPLQHMEGVHEKI